MFLSKSIQDGSEQIYSGSRLAETGADKKEFRGVFRAFRFTVFTVTIELYRKKERS